MKPLFSKFSINAVMNRIHPFRQIQGGDHTTFGRERVLAIIVCQRGAAEFTGKNIGQGLKELLIGGYLPP